MGFLILNAVLGGQALASASNGNLSGDVGIVIISLISLFVRIWFIFLRHAFIPAQRLLFSLHFADIVLSLSTRNTPGSQ